MYEDTKLQKAIIVYRTIGKGTEISPHRVLTCFYDADTLELLYSVDEFNMTAHKTTRVQ